MKGYRFITDDDTSKFCHRVTEALSNGWTLYGEPKMTFDQIVSEKTKFFKDRPSHLTSYDPLYQKGFGQIWAYLVQN